MSDQPKAPLSNEQQDLLACFSACQMSIVLLAELCGKNHELKDQLKFELTSIEENGLAATVAGVPTVLTKEDFPELFARFTVYINAIYDNMK